MTPLEDAERRSRLWHIGEAAAALIEMSRTRTVDDYANDLITRWAVERGLSIIGEAAVRLRRVDPEIAITDIHRIAGFRNRLVHEYEAVEPAEVWSIITDDLPRLLAEVRALLPPA